MATKKRRIMWLRPIRLQRRMATGRIT